MIVTEFSYIVAPKIESIYRFFGGVTQVVFSFSGAPESLRVEGSNSVNGLYTVIENAELKRFSSSSMRANIPASAGKQFFRIRQGFP
jgi:hypothetical protein